MREVWINHKQVDFVNAARQQKVTPGCALLDAENDGEMEDQFVLEPPESPEESREEVSPKYFNNVSNNFITFAFLLPI